MTSTTPNTATNGGQILTDEQIFALADLHAEDSAEDGSRTFDRGGLIQFAADLRADLAAVPASEPVNECRWPNCESEATQQALAEEVAESLFGAAAPASVAPVSGMPDLAKAEMLLEVIRIVRQYPDFDADDNAFGIMLDEALAGKTPALLSTIDSLANGLMPVAAPLPAAPAPTRNTTFGLDDNGKQVLNNAAPAPTYSMEAIEAEAVRNMAELQAKFPNDPDAQIRVIDAEIERQLADLSAAFPVAALPAEQAGELPPLQRFHDHGWPSSTGIFCLHSEASAALAARQALTVPKLDYDLLKLALEQTQERLRQAEEAIAKRDATALRVAQCAGEFARDAARPAPIEAPKGER
jgi:hypothetical protein